MLIVIGLLFIYAVSTKSPVIGNYLFGYRILYQIYTRDAFNTHCPCVSSIFTRAT